jgi:hypothetical protein
MRDTIEAVCVNIPAGLGDLDERGACLDQRCRAETGVREMAVVCPKLRHGRRPLRNDGAKELPCAEMISLVAGDSAEQCELVHPEGEKWEMFGDMDAGDR